MMEYRGQVLEEIDYELPVRPTRRRVEVVRDSESRTEMWLRGNLLKVFSTYNTYYGPDTDKDEAIKDANNLFVSYGIQPQDSVIIIVRQRYSKHWYYKVERDYVRESVKGKNPETISEEIVWSSPNTSIQDLALIPKDIKYW
jgi:hypothetical protein